MQFVLEIESKVMETSIEDKELTFEDVEQMLSNALTIFKDDIE